MVAAVVVEFGGGEAFWLGVRGVHLLHSYKQIKKKKKTGLINRSLFVLFIVIITLKQHFNVSIKENQLLYLPNLSSINIPLTTKLKVITHLSCWLFLCVQVLASQCADCPDCELHMCWHSCHVQAQESSAPVISSLICRKLVPTLILDYVYGPTHHCYHHHHHLFPVPTYFFLPVSCPTRSRISPRS